MSEDQPRTGHAHRRDVSKEIREGARPTTNQPLHAEPRPRIAPALLVVAILAAVIVIFFALMLL